MHKSGECSNLPEVIIGNLFRQQTEDDVNSPNSRHIKKDSVHEGKSCDLAAATRMPNTRVTSQQNGATVMTGTTTQNRLAKDTLSAENQRRKNADSFN